jgi:hypothetical protein
MYVVHGRRTIWPLFFLRCGKLRVLHEQYFEPFFQILTEEYAILQHFMEAFHEIFGKKIINQGL